MCQVVGFLHDDPIGQFVIERFVVLEPLNVGEFVDLTRKLCILASCLPVHRKYRLDFEPGQTYGCGCGRRVILESMEGTLEGVCK